MTVHTPTRRWDPLVKITHWGVAAVVVVNALIVGEGSIAHIYAGYILAALLGLRILWGFIGPYAARFSSFTPNPAKAFEHIGDIRAGRHEIHKSHNPLGALMAYALWACLAVIIASGIGMAGAPPAIDASVSPADFVSDEYREAADSSKGEESAATELFEEVHEVAVNLLYLLIALHIGGVAFETVRSGKRTLTAMLPGGK
ncbi:cytochrome b [Porphyrobacter sp. MBR-155]|jgi:cytochrome b|uniref:cytochrome b/b6 domain-containing protein n=1 Tax=Porphyrobacter sp. MBR-155 TaxID=3156464 RepID=UPI0033961482